MPLWRRGRARLYRAYLANVIEHEKLIVDQAQKSWSGMDIALRTAMSELKEASSGSIPTSLGLSVCRANCFLNDPEALLQAFVRGEAVVDWEPCSFRGARMSVVYTRQ